MTTIHGPLKIALLLTITASGCEGPKRTANRHGGSPPPTASMQRPGVNAAPAAPKQISRRAPTVEILRDAIHLEGKIIAKVKGGQVDGNVKRDGPDGFFIDPLYKALKTLVKRIRAGFEAPGLTYTGEMTVVTAPKTPYRILAEVVYTANQANFKRYTFLKVGEKATGRTSTISDLYFTNQTSPPPNPIGLTLVISTKGLFLKSKHGSECPKGVVAKQEQCFAAGRDGQFSAVTLKKMQHHLWYLYAAKYKLAGGADADLARHSITVAPKANVPYARVTRVLNVIRDIPRDAKNPPVKYTVPSGGCQMPYNAKTRTWDFSNSGGITILKNACMYHKVTLALGST